MIHIEVEMNLRGTCLILIRQSKRCYLGNKGFMFRLGEVFVKSFSNLLLIFVNHLVDAFQLRYSPFIAFCPAGIKALPELLNKQSRFVYVKLWLPFHLHH